MPLFWLIVIVIVVALLIGWWMVAGRTAPPVNRAAPGALPDTPAPALVMPEPVPAAPAPEPVMVAVSEPLAEASPSAGASDNLLLLKGVGPALDTLLRSLGVSRFDQIAAWTPADVARIDGQLGRFKGRIERDAWIEQARLLARGDKAGFEARFGKL